MLGCSGHGGNNPKQSEHCLPSNGALWDGDDGDLALLPWPEALCQ